LAPTSASEAEAAVADFDGNGVQHHDEEPAEQVMPVHAAAEIDEPVVLPAATELPSASEAVVQEAETHKTESEKAPRRSTVREKVSFVTEPKPEGAASAVNVTESVATAPAADATGSEPVAAEPTAAESAA